MSSSSKRRHAETDAGEELHQRKLAQRTVQASSAEQTQRIRLRDKNGYEYSTPGEADATARRLVARHGGPAAAQCFYIRPARRADRGIGKQAPGSPLRRGQTIQLIDLATSAPVSATVIDVQMRETARSSRGFVVLTDVVVGQSGTIDPRPFAKEPEGL